MRVRNFSKKFAPLVINGEKRCTIRATPKRMPKAGDKESWREWSGPPYHSKTIVLAEVEIISVEKITITADRCMVGETLLTAAQETALATADGFASVYHFRSYFVINGMPFKGILIKAK